MSLATEFVKGLWKENPVFRILLGLCPTLAVTSSAINGLGMGLCTVVVLVLANVLISSLRNVIPSRVRIPCFIVIIASFVTMVDLVMHGYAPALHEALGIFIPLIVVNCIILGRAEAFASKRPIVDSLVDGLGMGLGFTLALTVLGAVREILGEGAIFGLGLFGERFEPILVAILPPGAFITLGLLLAGMNAIDARRAARRRRHPESETQPAATP